VRPRGTPQRIEAWARQLRETDDPSAELLLEQVGIQRSVLARWHVADIASDLATWAEMVSDFAQDDADGRGGACAYEVTHRADSTTLASYPIRRLGRGDEADAIEAPSGDAIIAMLMRHNEAQQKQAQQATATLLQGVTRMMDAMGERLSLLERERTDILQRERESLVTQAAAENDSETANRRAEKLDKIIDIVAAKMLTSGD
jgi:hypothetical protein